MDVADTASTALATVPAPMLRANQSVIERDDMRESSMDKGKVARIVGTAAVIAIVVFAITARFLIKT